MNNQIHIELIDHMGSDLSTVNSARVSFGKCKDELDDQDKRLIRYLADHQHSTPFRHNQIQLRCKAPIFLARQLMKHQAGLSWNEVSRRYVDSEPEFYVPDNWRARPEAGIKQGSGDTHPGNFNIISAYENFLEQAASYYNWMLEIGVAPEMARMVLPQSMMTEWIWSGNLLAFAHVYNLRMGEGAQHEARVFAAQLDAIIESLFPISWTALTREGK